MLGKSRAIRAENEKLKTEIERLMKALETAKEEARENWRTYENYFRETHHNSVSKTEFHEMKKQLLDEVKRKTEALDSVVLKLEIEQEKHTKTQNILDRKKQQCKRYQKKIMRLNKSDAL